MTKVNDITKVVNIFFRPVGFKAQAGKKATIEEIRKWKDTTNPNVVQNLSYLTVSGIVITILGAIIGFIGFKKDSKLMKWLGRILALAGIGSGGIGIFFGTNEENSKSQQSNMVTDVVEQGLLKKLKEISVAEKSKQDGLRKNLLKEYRDYLPQIKQILEKNKSNSDPELVKQVEQGLLLINESGYIDREIFFEQIGSIRKECNLWGVEIKGTNELGEKYAESINSVAQKLGKEQIIEWLNNILTLDCLSKENCENLDETDQIDICNAVLCSAVLGDKDIVEKLITLLKNDNVHEGIRRNIILGLVFRHNIVEKDSRISMVFTDLLKDKEAKICISSVIALGEIKDKKAIEPLSLSNLINATETEVQKEAVHVLGEMLKETKDPDIVKALVRFANHPNVKIHVAALVILEENKNYVVSCLIEVIKSRINKSIEEHPTTEIWLLGELLGKDGADKILQDLSK